MQSDHGSQSPSQESDMSLSHVPPMAEVFALTREDAKILEEYVEEFQEGNADLRNTIVANAMAELSELHPETEPFNKIEASKKIRKWFYNHYSQPERQYFKFTRKWSARNAFYHMCRDEVMLEAEQMSGAPPGSQAFLGCLQDATTKLWKRLSEEEQELHTNLARKWSDNAPPPNIQARMATSMSAKMIRDFQTQLYKACGVRCVVLTTYENENGQIMTGMAEVSKALGPGNEFLKFCPDWKEAPLFREWQKYAKKSFRGGDVQTTQKDRSKTIKTPISIPIKSNGCPEIPDITMAQGYKTKVVQAMLRDYCTSHIRYISGKKKATIPWAKLCQDPPSWIKPECVPDGFQWADPSKIRIGDVFCLLDHWRQRQAHHLKPLIWASSCPLLEDAEKLSECSELSSETGNNTHPRSEDGVRSNSEDRNNTSSDDSSSPKSDGNVSEDGEQDMESPPRPARHSLHGGSGSPEEGRTYSPKFNTPTSTLHRHDPGPSNRHRHEQTSGHDRDYHSPSEEYDDLRRSEGDSSDLSDNPKRQVKMTERARNMDVGRGVGRLNTHFLQR